VRPDTRGTQKCGPRLANPDLADQSRAPAASARPSFATTRPGRMGNGGGEASDLPRRRACWS